MRTDVKKALRGRSLSFLGANREIRRLEEYLHDGEQVHDLYACTFGDTGGRALVAITDERVLAYKDGWIFKNSQGMSYADIRSIEIRTGIFWAKIKFKGEGMSFETTKVGRFAAEHAVKIIRGRIGSRYKAWEAQRTLLRQQAEQADVPTPTAILPTVPEANKPFFMTDDPLTLDQFLPHLQAEEAAAQNSSNNLVDELERLQVLKENGLLTDAEYATAKLKLLS